MLLPLILTFQLALPRDEPGPPYERLCADLLPSAQAATRAGAFDEVAGAGDMSFLPVLVDLLRFADTREEWFGVLDAAGSLLGEDLRQIERPWRTLSRRLGARDDLPLPRGYAAWKGELLAQRVDERFRDFLYDGVTSRVRLDEIVWGGVAVDGIPSLDQPEWLRAEKASALYPPEEPVFGLVLDGDARAFPLRVLDWHEMANATIGGEPVALAYCTLCGAGIAYRRKVGDRVLRFGSSGLLLRSNKLMFDRETKSLWNHLTGQAVLGPLAKEKLQLEVLPSVVTTWDDWRGRHPDTQVVSTKTGYARDYRPGAAYGDYFASPETMFPVPVDGKLAPKERLFVLRTSTQERAYALEGLRDRRVTNDTLGARTVVLLGPQASDPRPLPLPWESAWRGRWPEAPPVALGQLPLEQARRLLLDQPSLSASLSADDWLALATAVRQALLQDLADDLDLSLRNQVATRALVGSIRAYDRGQHTFRLGGDERLRDERGLVWHRTETALIGPRGEELERLPGHLAFAFAWEAFHPDEDVVP